MGDGGSSSADSYIGSLISLTSKSEIRYEGILYTVDTHNSNIALQNVRSFGTEGRKKGGPQIPASDKVYEYIIFRGSDIKDLQVKSSPPVQAPSQPHSDPAIISLQAQYSQPPAYQPAVALSADQNPSLPYSGMPAPSYQNGVSSLYHPAPAMGAWGPPLPPPGANATGLAMPMYWPGPGFYRAQPGHAHLQQHHPLLHSIPLPPLQPQPLMPRLDQGSLPTLNFLASSLPLQPPSDTLGGSAAPLTTAASVSSPVAASIMSTAGFSGADISLSSANSLPHAGSAVISPSTKTSRRESGLTRQPQVQSQYSGVLRTNISSTDTASGVISPSKRTASGSQQASRNASGLNKAPVSNPRINKLKQTYTEIRRPAIQPTFPTSLSAKNRHASTQPLLPLPVHRKHTHQGNGDIAYTHHVQRGRRKGRATMVGPPLQQFMEEFDFTAMNEKFNKDEVWGELGRGDARERISDEQYDLADGHVEDNVPDSTGAVIKSLHDLAKKPVYEKDDFFDTLSCAALDREEGRSERSKFSEQRKIDVETFGSFPVRFHGGRGRLNRHGGHRGGYYGLRSSGGRGNNQENLH